MQSKTFLRPFPLLILAVLVVCAITNENLLGLRAYGQSVAESRDSLSDDSNLQEESSSLIVKYIPGLFSFDNSQVDVLKNLEEIYKPKKVETIIWYKSEDLISNKKNLESAINLDIWKESVQLAEKTADNVFQDICKMSPEKQKNLILVGHSLGGRIVVCVLSKLQQKNLKIRQAILLGAAMNNNEQCLPSAVNASIDTVYSFVNPTDKWLTSSWAGVNRAMLGTGYAFYLDPKLFCEIQIDSTDSHDSEVYLRKFKYCMLDENMKQNCIIVPQGKKNIPEWFDEIKGDELNWTVIDTYRGWVLKATDKSDYYIVDDLSLVRAKGTKEVMEESFAKVKKQLKAGVHDGERVSTKDFSKIIVKQDESFTPCLGSSKELYWKNKFNEKGWRLQLNTKTSKFRILDPSSHVRAQGDKYTMEDAFYAVKKQIQK